MFNFSFTFSLFLQIDLPYGSSSSSAVGEEAALVYNADPPALIQTVKPKEKKKL